MESGLTASDVAVLSGNNGRNNDGFGGDWGAWIILFLIFGMFGWGGFGGGWGGNGAGANGGATPYSVGVATQADIQRGFDNQSVMNKLNGIQQGICDSTYALNNSIQNGFSANQLQLCNGFNQVQQGFNQLGYQVQQCCCDTQGAIKDVRYDMATQACTTQNTIQNTTRDILDNNNANTRAILDFLTNDKISTLQAENQSLKLAASQANQNAVLMAAMDAGNAELIRRLGADCPTPAYVVQPPTPVNFPTNCCGQFSGWGNGQCNC